MSTATESTTEYAVGSLVSARGRDWVVLPGSDETLLVLQPLGGGEDDVAGVLPALEEVEAASFAPPVAEDLGDARSARMLRDALRIGFRSSGGPFRCLAGISVSPRAYQLVPLLLALRQDTVRLLIADDVGIGKTVESGLVAAELLEQGAAQGLTVLCPPSLAAQWEQELSDKFGLDPQLVLPGTVRRLERGLTGDESIFTRHKVTIVSTDFIKSERRRHEFLRAAPDLVIVDEAHTCVNDDAGKGSTGRTQRYRLLQDLAEDPDRHLVLVTATPHSGNEGAFRNLVGLLDPRLADADLSTEDGRRLLAQQMVQRRRADIRHYLNEDTQFPSDRQVTERSYELAADHRALFDDVLAYVRGQVRDTTGTKLDQRVRWWSALALLRAVASSPAAAAATLATRSASMGADSAAAADALGRDHVLDQVDDEGGEGVDVTPGAVTSSAVQRHLSTLQRQAADLTTQPAADAKLSLLVAEVKKLLKGSSTDPAGFHPIVFCRFIATAHYVTAALRQALPKVTVEVVTGELPADERAGRVAALSERADGGPKVLVATDCLSEGVNLQDDFQAVVHYDLAWNPTRHEQREGRVDRFGQPRDIVRALMLYGSDTGIDGIVLEVLLRKHEAIRKDIGVSVAVPPQSDQVLAALLEGVLMRGQDGEQLTLDLGLMPEAEQLDEQWRSSADAEKRSRSRFAQASIHPDEVADALTRARGAMGEPGDVSGFVHDALRALGADLHDANGGGFTADLSNTPVGLRDALRVAKNAQRFVADLPAPRGSAVLQRTDPVVTSLARFVLDAALDEQLPHTMRPATRCGMIATHAVDRVTTSLLLRVRTHMTLPGRDNEHTFVAEEAKLVAFTGTPSDPTWLSDTQVSDLLVAEPDANVPRDAAVNTMRAVLGSLGVLDSALDDVAREVADELRESHTTVRRAARGDRAGRLRTQGLKVEPQLPPDILGVYVFRPVGGGQ